MSLIACVLDDARGVAMSRGGEETVQIVHADNRRVVVVADESKSDINVIKLRNDIMRFVDGVDRSSWRLVQVVGDSGSPFREDRLSDARKVLTENVDDQTIVEYGYTCSKYDANWLVDDVISTSALTSRTIANVVGQTVHALQGADWSGSDGVANFVLLYRKDGSITNFGEDTWLSDGIMSPRYGDAMLCFEGGLQAFHQCCSALLAGVKVIAITGLRPAAIAVPKFSAAELLIELGDVDPDKGFDETTRRYLKRNDIKADHSAKVTAGAHRLEESPSCLANLVHIKFGDEIT